MSVKISNVETQSIGRHLTRDGEQEAWQVVFVIDGDEISTRVEIQVAAPNNITARVQASNKLKMFLHEANAAARSLRPA